MLRKITGDGAQETLWRAYYDQCEAMYGKLFASGVSPVLKVGDDMIYRFDNAVSRAFEMYPYGSNNPEEMIPLSYVASTVGIDLAEELEVNGKSVRSFVYDETAMLLISREDASVQIVGPEVYGYFLELASPYLASEENMKGSFSVAFQALVSDFQNAYEGRQQLKKIGFSIMTDGRFAFTLKMANATACYALPARVENGLLVLEAFDYDNATENMDDNATIYYNKVASIKDMLNLLPGTYRLENKSGMHMNVIELLSEDSANSMLLERE